MDIEKKRNEVLKKIEAEEETENALIWLYDTLLDLGVENCLPISEQNNFRTKMKILADESREHKLILDKIKSNYNFK